MVSLSVSSLKEGMIVYEDVYSLDGRIIVKSNTILTGATISELEKNGVLSVSLADQNESNMTRYEHLHNNEHFKVFECIYNDSLTHFVRLMKNIEKGMDPNFSMMLELRDDIFRVLKSEEQLIEFLYNLMPNENEITFNHCFNCGLLCYIFGKWCGVPEEDLDNITLAGYLFDIGKTRVNDDILWKPNKLTPEEMIQLQHHIHLGYDILKPINNLPPHIITVLIMHHERADGSGYPAGINSSKIDPYAFIAAISDTYEAMTHPRGHRAALTPFQAIGVFEKQGIEKYNEKYARLILSKIAHSYVDRKVVLSNNISGRVSEIHEEALSRPTVFSRQVNYDLRKLPNQEIVRMG